MQEIGVYQIKNKENDLIYIGSSKNIKKRWKTHISKLKNGKHDNMFLQNDWDNYGECVFEFSILEECKEEERFELEQKYINTFLPFNRNGNGYNINENAGSQNKDGIRIFRNRYKKYNPFYKSSKESIKERLLEMEEDGELWIMGDIDDEVEGTNTKDKYIWETVSDDIYMVKPTFGKMRAISRELVDSMTREELDYYCNGMDTYADLLEMAYDGYMDEEYWL